MLSKMLSRRSQHLVCASAVCMDPRAVSKAADFMNREANLAFSASRIDNCIGFSSKTHIFEEASLSLVVSLQLSGRYRAIWICWIPGAQPAASANQSGSRQQLISCSLLSSKLTEWATHGLQHGTDGELCNRGKITAHWKLSVQLS